MSAQLATDIQALHDRIRTMERKIDRCRSYWLRQYPLEAPSEFWYEDNAGSIYLSKQVIYDIDYRFQQLVLQYEIFAAVLYDLGECYSVWVRNEGRELIKSYLASYAGGWPDVNGANVRTQDEWLIRCNAILDKLETYWLDYSTDNCLDDSRMCRLCYRGVKINGYYDGMIDASCTDDPDNDGLGDGSGPPWDGIFCESRAEPEYGGYEGWNAANDIHSTFHDGEISISGESLYSASILQVGELWRMSINTRYVIPDDDYIPVNVWTGEKTTGVSYTWTDQYDTLYPRSATTDANGYYTYGSIHYVPGEYWIAGTYGSEEGWWRSYFEPKYNDSVSFNPQKTATGVYPSAGDDYAPQLGVGRTVGDPRGTYTVTDSCDGPATLDIVEAAEPAP